MADARDMPLGAVIPVPERGAELRVEHRGPHTAPLIGLYRGGERIRDLTLMEEEYVASAWIAGRPSNVEIPK